MAKSTEDCIEEAKAVLSAFDSDDLHAYINNVFRIARSYENMSGGAAMKAAIEEVNNKEAQSLFEQCGITANNTLKFNRLSEAIGKGKANLLQTIARVYGMQKGKIRNLGDLNIESAQRAMRDQLSKEIMDRLSAEENTFLQQRQNAGDIARAMDGKSASDMAKAVAEKIKPYIDFRNEEMVKSNALLMSDMNKDRQFRMSHDPSLLLRAGRSAVNAARSRAKYTVSAARGIWREFIKDLLDKEETFSNTKAMNADGTFNENEVNNILDGIFNNITTGKSQIFTKSEAVNDREAVARKSRMFLKFRDEESAMKYRDKYSRDSDYFSVINSDIHSSANRIGVARVYGDSPYNTFLDLEKSQTKYDEENLNKSKGALWYRKAGLVFKQVLGENSAPVDPHLANIMANFRVLTSLGRLVKVPALSFTDIIQGASYARQWGIGAFESYGQFLTGLFNFIKTDERQYIASLFKSMCDSHLGYMGRYSDAANITQGVEKFTMGFFRTIGMIGLDNGNKLSMITLMARSLGRESEKSFDSLSNDLKQQLDKFGITDKEWNALRQECERGYFTTKNVDNLSNDQLKSIYGNSSGIPLYDLRNTLYAKVHSLFDVASENAVLSPNAFSKAFVSAGLPPGSIGGEIVRSIMQFKSYPLAYIDRVLLGGFKNAVGTQAKLGFALQLFTATLPLSYLSTWMGYAMSGKTMPTWDRMNTTQKINFTLSLLTPGLGILSLIFDPNDQNQNLLTNLFSSPSTQMISSSFSGIMALMEGNTKTAESQFSRAGNSIIPVKTLPAVSPWVRHMLGDKPYLQPGQKQYYGS